MQTISLDSKEDSDKKAGETNLAWMAHTLSDSKFGSGSGLNMMRKMRLFSNLSHSNLITFFHDLMSHCQDKERHMKVIKKQLDFLKEEYKSYKETVKTLERNLAS